MANSEIRQAIESSNLYYWQVAEALGINDGNFSRKLRRELSESEKDNILIIINNLKNNLKDGE